MTKPLPSSHPFSRRDFLKKSSLIAALGATGGLVPGAARADQPTARSRSGKAKNIIFMVSDGMSQGTLSMTDHFLRWRDGKPSQWINLYHRPGVSRGLMDMASASNLVTDSGAASSSWGCGQRVINGQINVNPQGEEIDPILLIAHRHGLRTGLVTTATVTHATPAGFAANGPDRRAEEDFAVQYLERGVDVILGGGEPLFSSSGRSDQRDLIGEFRKKGYTTPTNRTDLLAHLEAEKILGLFAPRFLPYEIDRQHDPESQEGVPSLAEMSQVALETLTRENIGFILQIEGARVDHAAHNNDLSGLIYDQIAFDEAIGVAVKFIEDHPDTLLIVTTDHGNANPGLNQGSNQGKFTLGRLQGFTGSLSKLCSQLEAMTDPEIGKIHELVTATTGMPFRSGEARSILNHLRDGPQAHYRRMAGLNAVLGQILANHLEVGWVGNSHTSDYVELAGIGPGSEKIKPFNLNTDLFTLMKEALDLDPAVR